ncbi:MAG: type II toxin-antitoxin system VapC family toxin, partial [Longimicrobiales bacterium]
MTYAVAALSGEPLLFTGEDFGQTDLEPALWTQRCSSSAGVRAGIGEPSKCFRFLVAMIDAPHAR